MGFGSLVLGEKAAKGNVMKLTGMAALLGLVLAGGGADDAIKKDKDKLQGRWQVIESEAKGEKALAAEIAALEIIFTDDNIKVKEADKVQEKFAFKIDPTQKPKTMDLTIADGPNKGRTDRAIYELDGDNLKICIQANKDGERPREFKTKAGTDLWLVVLKRAK